MPLIAIALLIAAALGGGVSVAANNSLPGDALWGFKTTVNENIEGAFASGDKAKADWDISIAAARLDEAQKLAASGKLDANAQAAITSNFDAHTSDVATRIQNLEASGKTTEAADVATRFQATLAQHASGVAEASASQDSSAQTNMVPFLTSVRGTLDNAATLSASASAQAQGSIMASSTDSDSAATNSSSSSTSGSINASGSLKVNTSGAGDASSSTNDSGTVNVNVY